MLKNKNFAILIVLLIAIPLILSACAARNVFQGRAEHHEKWSTDEAPVMAELGGPLAVHAPEPVSGVDAELLSRKLSDVETGEEASITASDFNHAGVGDVKERRVIHNAFLGLEVENILEAVRQLEEIAKNNEGLVTVARIYRIDDERRGGNITMRIPNEHFNHTLALVEELGEVKDKHTYIDDVTTRYIDLEARIKNLQAQEKRFLEILEQAETVEDILNVEREIERVRGNLESLQGQFIHLKDRVDYATITVRIKEQLLPRTVISPDYANLGEHIVQTFIRNTNWMLRAGATILVFSIGMIPILVPTSILLIILLMLYRRYRKNKVL